MEITQEILENNGYRAVEGLNFPFNVTPLYEHPETKVYVVNSAMQDSEEHYIWLWGVSNNTEINEGEGHSVEQFNMYLSNNGFPVLKMDN